MERKRLSFMDEEQGEAVSRRKPPCQGLDTCLQRPIVIASVILVLILLCGSGVWVFAARFLQEFENIADVFEYFKGIHNEHLPDQSETNIVSTRGFLGGLFPQVAAATTSTTATNRKSVSSMISQIDGYYLIGRDNDTTYVQKSCPSSEQCKKIRFNDMQQKEIAGFLGTCIGQQRCNTKNVTVNNGLCVVCHYVVHMKLSPFSICVDFHGFLNSGLISSYIFYSDVLHALYRL